MTNSAERRFFITEIHSEAHKFLAKGHVFVIFLSPILSPSFLTEAFDFSLSLDFSKLLLLPP